MKWNDPLTAYVCVAVAVLSAFSLFVLKYFMILKSKLFGSKFKI